MVDAEGRGTSLLRALQHARGPPHVKHRPAPLASRYLMAHPTLFTRITCDALERATLKSSSGRVLLAAVGLQGAPAGGREAPGPPPRSSASSPALRRLSMRCLVAQTGSAGCAEEGPCGARK